MCNKALRWIESLDVSVVIKALLADHLKLGAEVGNAVLRLGRIVLDQLVALLIKCSDYAYKRIGCTYQLTGIGVLTSLCSSAAYNAATPFLRIYP